MAFFYKALKNTDMLFQEIDREVKELLLSKYSNLRIEYVHIGQIPPTIIFNGRGIGGFDFIANFRRILNNHNCTDLESVIELHGHFVLKTDGRGKKMVTTRAFQCIHYKITDNYEGSVIYVGGLKNNELSDECLKRINELLKSARAR